MTDLAEHMLGSFRLMLVQKHIFCPITGQVLDIRSCRFILDADGDPAVPVSPDGAAMIQSFLDEGRNPLREGYTLEAAK